MNKIILKLGKKLLSKTNISASRASILLQSAGLCQQFLKERKLEKKTVSTQSEPDCFFLSCWRFHSISGPGMRFKYSKPTLTFQVIYHCFRRPRQDLIRLERAPITESDNTTRANQHAAWAYKQTCSSRSSSFPHHEFPQSWNCRTSLAQ